MNQAEIRDNYRRMPEHSIRQVALYEVRDLTAEGVDALRVVLNERGVSRDFNAAVDGQLADFTMEKHSELMRWFRTSQCPICGVAAALLNAAAPVKVSSFIFVTTESKEVVVGCPSCLKEAVRRANVWNFCLGWWGFPWGPIKTIAAMIENQHWCQWDDDAEPTDPFIAHVYENLGRLIVQYSRNADPFDEPD